MTKKKDPMLTRDTKPRSAPSVAAEPVDLAPSPTDSSLAAVLKRSILEKQADRSPHLIVEARAGTGKTTTLIEGLRRVKGEPTPGFIPSPQQAAVFEQMELSRGKANTICFVAFNRSIADELVHRVPRGCDAMTMHKMGLRAVTRALPDLLGFNLDDANLVVPKIVASLMGSSLADVRRDPRQRPVLSLVDQFVSLCKMNLISTGDIVQRPGGQEVYDWRPPLLRLADEYDIELNGQLDAVVQLVPNALLRCKNPTSTQGFNMDDMIWLPVILDLPVTRYDLLLVDEAQDLNRCQQALAQKAGCRLVLCGDPRQAIYAFAGADSESMSRMEQELKSRGRGTHAGERGCVTLPLTVTRRCGQAIVEEARKIVPDFEAHESNPEGRIYRMHMREGAIPTNGNYMDHVTEGDLVLCRVNSRLISQCLRFFKAGRRAYIQGKKDVAKGLVSLIERLADVGCDVANLITNLDAWHSSEVAKEQAKELPSENKLEDLTDKRACIMAMCDSLQATDPARLVVTKLEALFSDAKQQEGTRLSSIHKAKGLESKRVFLLSLPSKKEDMPPAWVRVWARSAKDRAQEMNLLYVAITRAIEELIYVS